VRRFAEGAGVERGSRSLFVISYWLIVIRYAAFELRRTDEKLGFHQNRAVGFPRPTRKKLAASRRKVTLPLVRAECSLDIRLPKFPNSVPGPPPEHVPVQP
jgi:hypothetical protein